MDSELIDLVARTRPVILEILENRGYDVSAHRDIAPAALFKMATADPNGNLLRIVVSRKKDAVATNEIERCQVLYWINNPVRQKLDRLWDDDELRFDPLKEEVIIILSEPPHEIFHVHAAKRWATDKSRVSFFNIRHLTSNPAKHTYVPPHRKLSDEEAKEVMAKLNVRSKTEFPRIIYHVDMQARVLGLVPGDLVEIKRPSPTTGEYTLYRFCSV